MDKGAIIIGMISGPSSTTTLKCVLQAEVQDDDDNPAEAIALCPICKAQQQIGGYCGECYVDVAAPPEPDL